MASTFQLCSMILPQLENKFHGVEVVGMMFFDDNLNVLAKGNEFGERLSKVAKEQNILLMICDQCAIRRGFGEGDFEQCGTGEERQKGLLKVLLPDVSLNCMRHFLLIHQIKLLLFNFLVGLRENILN